MKYTILVHTLNKTNLSQVVGFCLGSSLCALTLTHLVLPGIIDLSQSTELLIALTALFATSALGTTLFAAAENCRIDDTLHGVGAAALVAMAILFILLNFIFLPTLGIGALLIAIITLLFPLHRN